MAVTGDDAHTADHTTARSMAGLIFSKGLNVSCFNGSKARILQTHYANGPLVVCKLCNLRFSLKEYHKFQLLVIMKRGADHMLCAGPAAIMPLGRL
jgi:hypothetical protein